MDNKDLFAEYGELVVKAEMLNNRIQELRKQIAEVVNKPKVEPEDENETA